MKEAEAEEEDPVNRLQVKSALVPKVKVGDVLFSYRERTNRFRKRTFGSNRRTICWLRN